MDDSIVFKLKSLSETKERISNEIDSIQAALARFPDLKEIYLRDSVLYVTSAVNLSVDSLDIKNSCTCCVDSNVWAVPFIQFKGIKICAGGSPFIIGVNGFNGTKQYRKDWKVSFVEHDISNRIYEKLRFIDQAIENSEPEDLNDFIPFI